MTDLVYVVLLVLPDVDGELQPGIGGVFTDPVTAYKRRDALVGLLAAQVDGDVPDEIWDEAVSVLETELDPDPSLEVRGESDG